MALTPKRGSSNSLRPNLALAKRLLDPVAHECRSELRSGESCVAWNCHKTTTCATTLIFCSSSNKSLHTPLCTKREGLERLYKQKFLKRAVSCRIPSCIRSTCISTRQEHLHPKELCSHLSLCHCRQPAQPWINCRTIGQP